MANPDYVVDWRAHSGPALIEPPPYAWRRQAEADLKAARWNLLAREDPRHPQWAAPFRVDMPTVEVRVAEQGRHLSLARPAARGWCEVLRIASSDADSEVKWLRVIRKQDQQHMQRKLDERIGALPSCGAGAKADSFRL